MKWINALHRRFHQYHVPFVTETIIAGQVVFFGLAYNNPEIINEMALVWQPVMAGEWWRLVTFVFIPFSTSPLWVLFAWSLFYLFGSALDQHWGTFRYNIFLLIAYLALVGLAWIVPYQAMSSSYMYMSVFLAFAFLYPDFELLLFFILPVKVKWLALIAWIGIGIALLFGTTPTRLAAIAPVANFLIFFGGDVINMVKTGKKRMARKAENIAERNRAFHTCAVCGKTDKTDPDEYFRYAKGPDGPLCFCEEHFDDHEQYIEEMKA